MRYTTACCRGYTPSGVCDDRDDNDDDDDGGDDDDDDDYYQTKQHMNSTIDWNTKT